MHNDKILPVHQTTLRRHTKRAKCIRVVIRKELIEEPLQYDEEELSLQRPLDGRW